MIQHISITRIVQGSSAIDKPNPLPSMHAGAPSLQTKSNKNQNPACEFQPSHWTSPKEEAGFRQGDKWRF